MAVIFLKIKAKKADVAVATESILNADIRKKNNISLSSLSSQSTRVKRRCQRTRQELVVYQ